MKHPLWVGLVGLACLGLMNPPARALVMMLAPPAIGQRVALADVVVVGKVTGFGDKLVSARPPYGGDKVDYQIAVVQVGDALLGAKDAKEIKVGFLPAAGGPAPGPRPIRRFPQFNLSLQQEGCLFLVKHPEEDFYIGLNYYDMIGKQDNGNFDKDMEEVKRCVKLLADPAAGFKAKSADDRLLTAAMLVTRCRTQRPGAVKTEPIDAEQSKQILLALADADWTPKAVVGPGRFTALPLNAQSIFFQLGLTEKDGWTPPKDAAAIPDAARQWLKDNAEKYRIERFVAEKKNDAKDEK